MKFKLEQNHLHYDTTDWLLDFKCTAKVNKFVGMETIGLRRGEYAGAETKWDVTMRIFDLQSKKLINEKSKVFSQKDVDELLDFFKEQDKNSKWKVSKPLVEDYIVFQYPTDLN